MIKKISTREMINDSTREKRVKPCAQADKHTKLSVSITPKSIRLPSNDKFKS